MLSESYGQFIKSHLFLGGPTYGKNSLKIKPWYNFLYIAQFEGRFDKVKVGISSNIQRRNKELRRENEGGNIRYAWNMPTNLEIETKVKDLLSEFTRRFSSKRLKTETFYLPITPFVLFVRLVILYVYLEGGYITGGNEEVKNKLELYLGRARIEYIKHNDIYYRQQNNSPRMKAIIQAQRLIRDVLDIQRKMKKRGENYSFATANDFYYLPDIIDQMRSLTKSKGTYPSDNKQKGEFIEQWVEQYTEEGEMNDELMKFLPKEGQDRTEFKEGDLVTITYPKYRPADTGRGGMAKQGDPEYPEGGSWQGRIVKKSSNKRYMIKWAFGEFKDTETLVPVQFIHHDGDVQRGIDLTKIYIDLKLPTTIDYGQFDELDDNLSPELRLLADAIVEASQEGSTYKLKM